MGIAFFFISAQQRRAVVGVAVGASVEAGVVRADIDAGSTAALGSLVFIFFQGEGAV